MDGCNNEMKWLKELENFKCPLRVCVIFFSGCASVHVGMAAVDNRRFILMSANGLKAASHYSSCGSLD